ncbi:pyridoxamine 5'-phosphate oxidase family protein [Leucobacter sp. HY1908]
MTTERAAFDALCRETVLAHVAVVVEGQPVAMPTAFGVFDDHLVIHGSTGSRWMRALLPQEVSVSITRATGLVVARSMFESSMWYRSAVVFGRFAAVPEEQRDVLLRRLTDRLLPGRSAETRPSTRKELAATMLLAMPIERWSLRVSEEMPDDEPGDIAGPAWAGVIELGPTVSGVLPAPDLNEGIAMPASVTEFTRSPRGLV